MSAYTEGEAQKLWCPEARVASGAGSYNRVQGEQLHAVSSMCKGSKCMAWRWTPAEKLDSKTKQYYRLGYCGKAGAP
jgi:hypothetical protein